jgi:hypothetical protein
LEQLVSLKDESASVIVDRSKSNCAPSARESDVFESLDAVNAATKDKQGWRDPAIVESSPSATRVSHQERLDKLPDCEDADGEAPCKMGGIIIEESKQSESGDVWRRD